MNIDEEAANAVTVTHIEHDGHYVLINGLLHSAMPRFEYEDSAARLATHIRLILTAFGRRCAEDMRERCANVVADEPEFPDNPPFKVRVELEKLGPIEACRFATRLTKKCILERLQAIRLVEVK